MTRIGVHFQKPTANQHRQKVIRQDREHGRQSNISIKKVKYMGKTAYGVYRN